MLLSVSSINFNKRNYSNGSLSRSSRVSFEKSPEKIIEHLQSCHPGHLIKSDISFDEALRVYELMGFNYILKRGSHVQLVKKGVNPDITLPRPHGNNKSITPYDIKILKKEVDNYLSSTK